VCATQSLGAITVGAERLLGAMGEQHLRYSRSKTRLAMDGLYHKGTVVRLAPP